MHNSYITDVTLAFLYVAKAIYSRPWDFVALVNVVVESLEAVGREADRFNDRFSGSVSDRRVHA